MLASAAGGILPMLAAIALLSTMDVLGKSLTMVGVTVIQILALRSLVIVPFLVAGFAFRGRTD